MSLSIFFFYSFSPCLSSLLFLSFSSHCIDSTDDEFNEANRVQPVTSLPGFMPKVYVTGTCVPREPQHVEGWIFSTVQTQWHAAVEDAEYKCKHVEPRSAACTPDKNFIF